MSGYTRAILSPTSPRLTYQRLAEPQIDAFHRLCLDDHVRRYLLDGLLLPRAWAAAELVRSDELFDEAGVGLWLLHADGELVGFCGFRVFDEHGPEPQLLYAFPREFGGSGLASECAGALIDHVGARGWPRVLAAVDEPNRASMRVLDKVGMTPCGRVPGAFGHTVLFERWLTAAPARLDLPRGARIALPVASAWNGAPAHSNETVDVGVELGDDELIVRVEAPYHGDPAPAGAPGPTAALWEHEVVELMLLGDDDRYLELELAPRGHYLVLELHGRRRVVHQGRLLAFRAEIAADRWQGEARVPLGWVPPGCRRLNAYAIHGLGAARRYLCWQPTGDEHPDFHDLGSFGALADCLRSA